MNTGKTKYIHSCEYQNIPVTDTQARPLLNWPRHTSQRQISGRRFIRPNQAIFRGVNSEENPGFRWFYSLDNWHSAGALRFPEKLLSSLRHSRVHEFLDRHGDPRRDCGVNWRRDLNSRLRQGFVESLHGRLEP